VTLGRSLNFRDNVSVGHVRSLQRFLAPLEVPLAREVLYLKIDRVLQESANAALLFIIVFVEVRLFRSV